MTVYGIVHCSWLCCVSLLGCDSGRDRDPDGCHGDVESSVPLAQPVLGSVHSLCDHAATASGEGGGRGGATDSDQLIARD